MTENFLQINVRPQTMIQDAYRTPRRIYAKQKTKPKYTKKKHT